MKTVEAIWKLLISISIGLLAWAYIDNSKQVQSELEALRQEKQTVVYKPDKAGVSEAQIGKVLQKTKVEGRHTILVGGYGRFVVTEDEYTMLKLGDDTPEHILERGS